MTTIEIFDPALCCSTGVCGVDVDRALVTFAADVDWLKSQGVRVVRANLAQQPPAFAEHRQIRQLLRAQIDLVRARHAQRLAVLPLLGEEPVGAGRLARLVQPLACTIP